MTRRVFIEMILRQIYGGFLNDDAEITPNLVNVWLNPAIGSAAQANYRDNLKLDGIACVNNSFYTTYKGIAITADDFGVYKIELPHLPFGLGTSDGISTLLIKDNASPQKAYNVAWLSENQRSYQRGMRAIPNKMIAYSEGKYVYLESVGVDLTGYTAQATMVSGGSTSMDSEINVPDDYLPLIVEYIKAQLNFERNQPKDLASGDGQDFIKSV